MLFRSSTHIVEDIASTCRRLAIMNMGRIVFQGSTEELASEARGKVWMVTTDGSKPAGDFTVVSTMNMGATVRYRVVGDLAESSGATPTDPSLEDSYVWLMRDKRNSVVSAAR